MPTTDKAIRAYLDRLISVPDYASREGISLVQAHRRIKEGKADVERIGKHVFVVATPSPPQP